MTHTQQPMKFLIYFFFYLITNNESIEYGHTDNTYHNIIMSRANLDKNNRFPPNSRYWIIVHKTTIYINIFYYFFFFLFKQVLGTLLLGTVHLLIASMRIDLPWCLELQTVRIASECCVKQVSNYGDSRKTTGKH